MDFSCSASVPQFKFCSCILFYKGTGGSEEGAELCTGLQKGTIRHGGRKSGTSRKRNSGEGSCRREGAETGGSSALGQQYLLEHTSVT